MLDKVGSQLAAACGLLVSPALPRAVALAVAFAYTGNKHDAATSQFGFTSLSGFAAAGGGATGNWTRSKFAWQARKGSTLWRLSESPEKGNAKEATLLDVAFG